MKIGICGGTFDPIHIGHLAVAELVRCEYGLDRVLFIPSGRPPHKNLDKVTAPEHRLNMVKCAISSNPKFEAATMEIEREGYTYTVDTLSELQSLYPKETEFFYIIGADVVMELRTWKNADKVFALTNFIALMRPGFIEEDFNRCLCELRQDYKINIQTFDIPLIEISSTFIRERLRAGKSVKYLIKEEVLEYIIENGLYSG